MSFMRTPKQQPVTLPSAADTPTQPSERQRRLGSGGTRSSFLGSIGQSALAGPSPVLTGQSGVR